MIQEKSFFVHPKGFCESDNVGEGTNIWAFAHVMSNARIGKNCNICDHVFIESGAWIGDRVTVKNQVMIWDGITIEDDAFIGPGVIFTNDKYPRSPRIESISAVRDKYLSTENWLEKTIVQHGVTIAAGASIIPGILIGAFAFIGAGAVVTNNVKPHSLVAGNPGRHKGWVCFCGFPLRGDMKTNFICEKCKAIFKKKGDHIEAVD